VVLAAAYNLSMAYIRAGYLKQAEPLAYEAYSLRAQGLGEEHPKTWFLKLHRPTPISDVGYDQEIIDLLTPALAVFRLEYGGIS